MEGNLEHNEAEIETPFDEFAAQSEYISPKMLLDRINQLEEKIHSLTRSIARLQQTRVSERGSGTKKDLTGPRKWEIIYPDTSISAFSKMAELAMGSMVEEQTMKTGKQVYGEEDGNFVIENVLTRARPAPENRLPSIGSADEILAGQHTGKEEKPKELDLEVAKVFEGVESKETKLKREQQEVVDKYGWKALEEMTQRLKLPILIDKPHA